MKRYKLRNSTKYSEDNPRQEQNMVIGIPNEVAIFFPEVSFTAEKMTIGSKVGIFLESGTVQIITNKQVEEYEYE